MSVGRTCGSLWQAEEEDEEREIAVEMARLEIAVKRLQRWWMASRGATQGTAAVQDLEQEEAAPLVRPRVRTLQCLAIW
jgi:hypothetical protein